MKGNTKNLKSWLPGQSGNPGGRPRGYADARELARSHSRAAIQTLVDLMRRSKSDRIRVLCAEAILDRAWGRPAIAVLHADVTEHPTSPAFLEDNPEQQWQHIKEVCQILVDCGAVRVSPAGAGSSGEEVERKNATVLPS